MSDVTLNNVPASACAVLLPRLGAWTADVELDTDRGPTGAVTLAVGALTLRGAIVRGAAFEGGWRGRVVGGAGGLRRDVAAVAQRGGTLAVALRDALAAAGEALAPGDDLSEAAPLWHRLAGPAGAAVADVARAAGCAWRVLPDGGVWVGRETWPTHAPDVDVIDWRPEVGRLELAGEVLGILPGQTLRARADLTVRVGCVEHRVTGDALRTVVLAEPEAVERGRLLDAFQRLLAPLSRRIDYQALHAARVVAQAADGTLELIPDDPRVPPCRGVPIRYGLPGVRVVVPAGVRVLLTYEGGDPRRPVATLWELGDVTRLVVDGGTHPAARQGHATSDGVLSVMAVNLGGGTGAVLTFTYVPAAGAPIVVPVTFAAPVTFTPEIPPPGVPIALSGLLTEGTDVVHLP